ncbi:hypothetical protein BCR43DRAFT_563331 [Syncephalastrum racemosum]|uniref:RRM Nup35-type domain-containing protein n=1 Tax=Syncephalastrum racemosum TaxID=13706 RepID=A0A1X2HGG3_SYNRA|nr:hypothetical protein BCR43DRAFT_563331 [Syncephalastrum racemosum]
MFNFGQSSQGAAAGTSTSTAAPAFGSTSSAAPSFGSSAPSFGSSAPSFGQSSSTTTPSFGQSNPTGHQRSNTTLFTPASTSTTPSLFGGATQQTSTSQAPSSTFSFGNATNTTGTGSIFNKPATATGSTSTQGTGLGFGGFGSSLGGLNTSNTAQPQSTFSSSLFGGQQQQQQQQQQQNQTTGPLLSFSTCFPDTNVPHFVVKPDTVTRTSLPPAFFIGESAKTRVEVEQEEDTPKPWAISGDRAVLPRYLTLDTIPSTATSDANQEVSSGQKRKNDSARQIEPRKSLFKTTHHNDGIFAKRSASGSFADSNSRVTRRDTDDPPAVSIWDIGINPNKYNLETHTPPADTWSDSVTHVRPNPTNMISADKLDRKGTNIVRVFGFTPDLQTEVINHFNKYGLIEERHQQANWITFRYSAYDATQKALQFHGQILARNCMIGVVPATSMTELTTTK